MFGTRVKGKKAHELVDAGAVLIDTRDPISFRDGTVTGAINLQLRQVSSLMGHPKNTKFVLFGACDDDENLLRMTSYLSQMGFNEIFVLGCKDNWNKY